MSNKNFLKIGKFEVGYNKPSFFIAEIGINHNGDLEIAKDLIRKAKECGVQAVKFQKRTVDVVYSKDELSKPRQSVFGDTNGDLKRGLEFNKQQYYEINKLCSELEILWTASCWDNKSLDFIMDFNPSFLKIASASLTDANLLKQHAQTKKPIILSTGMSTLKQIDKAVSILGKKNLILLHCTSTYPGKVEELNLRAIRTLEDRYKIPVGYSGHEVGLSTTLASIVMGACVVERHITLDRSMWGSDQSASLEILGLMRLVRDIRVVEKAMGDGVKKVYKNELPIIEKLRRVNDF